MSTKSGRRSSIRELKPGASKKRSRKLETKTVAEAAVATDVVEEPVEEAATEPAEPTSSEPSESAPPGPTSGDDDGLANEAEAEAIVSGDAEGEAAARDDAEPAASEPVSGDGIAEAFDAASEEDVEPTPIEAAMLAELSEGVTDNTEEFLEGLIEALLFSSDRPMPAKELARAAGIDRRRAEELVAGLKRRYETGGLTVEEVAGGYVMRSSPRYASYIQKLLALRPVRLSRAQLETLAIVAYRQPVTKPEVDDIRGVDSGQVLKGLLERELLKIVGKKDEPGRPMLYGTTTAFLELLNLQSLKDLPTLREFTELNEESKRKFAEETGESPDESVPAAGEGTAEDGSAAEAPLEPTSENDGGEPAAAGAETESDADRGEAPADDDENAAASDIDDPESPGDADEVDVSDGAAASLDDGAETPQASARRPRDEDEDGIDLDVLADASELEEDEAPASRG